MAFTRTAGNAQYVTKGAPGIAGHFTSNRIYSLSDMIVFQERRHAKLDNALRAKLSVIAVDDPEPKVIQDIETPIQFAVTTASSTGTNSNDTVGLLDVDLAFLQPGDVLEIDGIFVDADGSNRSTTKFAFSTNQLFPEAAIIQSVTPGAIDSTHGNLVLSRNNGQDGTATAITTSMKLNHIGNALVDGGNSPTPIHYEPSHIQNYCQFFSRTWSMTRSEEPLNVYGKQSMEDRAAKKRREFFRGKELAMFRGRKATKTVNQNTQWMTGGMVEFVPGTDSLDGVTRLIDFGGPFDLDTYQTQTEIIGRYGSDSKDWFVGGKFLTSLWQHFQQSITLNDTVSRRYGWAVWELDLGHTIALLSRHPMFTDVSGLIDYNFDAAICDLEYIKQMVYIDVQTRDDVQAPNTHRTENEIFCQVGLWRTFQSAHGYIYGITA